MATEVRVPALGESVTEATVATWFKKPGDAVAADEMLCELETDKVTVEVPAPAAGTLGEIVAPEGATVGPNALLATIVEGAAAPAAAPVAADVATAPQDSPATHPAPVGAPSDSAPVPTSRHRRRGRAGTCRGGGARPGHARRGTGRRPAGCRDDAWRLL